MIFGIKRLEIIIFLLYNMVGFSKEKEIRTNTGFISLVSEEDGYIKMKGLEVRTKEERKCQLYQ